MHSTRLPSRTFSITKAATWLVRVLLASVAIGGVSSCAPSRQAATSPSSPDSLPQATSSATPPSAGRVVSLQDIDVYYEDYGEGEPVLLLHGGMGSAEDWSNQIGPFSDLYRVIVPDSRAQGRTAAGDLPLTYHLMAEDALRLMDYLNISSAFIVGYSDGGIVALDIAINHPNRARAIVAYGAHLTPDDLTASVVEFIRDSSPEDLEAFFDQPYLRLSKQPEDLPEIVQKMRTLWLTEPNLAPGQLGNITVPVLVIDGEEEDVVQPEHAAEIAAVIPGAALVILPGVGHDALTANPVGWNKVVLDFLAAH